MGTEINVVIGQLEYSTQCGNEVIWVPNLVQLIGTIRTKFSAVKRFEEQLIWGQLLRIIGTKLSVIYGY